MEKKTVGKFISALRKANGMTQKELGEKLFVSDKTVSRWECDECTPELSLIPSIAEIFGITTDELLRGERNNPDREHLDDMNLNKLKAKSDKQFSLLLDRIGRKFKNLTLISVSITLLGFIAAIVINIGFSNGLIAFAIAAAFCTVGEISEICFVINARILPDEDNAVQQDNIHRANAGFYKTAVATTFFNIALISFCLPLVIVIDGGVEGLAFFPWLGNGLVFAIVGIFVLYPIYALLIRKPLLKRGRGVLSAEETEWLVRDERTLKRSLLFSTLTAVFIGICIVVWYAIGQDIFLEVKTFDNCDEFKSFMESDYDSWHKKLYGTPMLNGEPINGDDQNNTATQGKMYFSISDFNGEEICSYYANPDLYWRVEFTASSEDRMPVTVITNTAVYRARAIFQTVETALYLLILADFIVFALIYLRERKKNR